MATTMDQAIEPMWMDWFKGKFTGNPHISWENPGFPVDFPLNQSIDNANLRNPSRKRRREILIYLFAIGSMLGRWYINIEQYNVKLVLISHPLLINPHGDKQFRQFENGLGPSYE